MTRFKVFVHYTCYWLVFALTFAVMFALLLAAAVGIPFGVMLLIFGIAASVGGELVITELAPRFMMFGGPAVIFLSAACGLVAVKLGFVIARRFLKVKRRCDRLRGR